MKKMMRLLNSNKDISKILSTLVMATWGDINAEKSIQEMVLSKLKNNKDINSIWSNFPNKIDQILRAGFDKVHYSAVSTINKTNKYVNKSLKDNKEILTSINSEAFNEYILIENKRNNEIEDKTQNVSEELENKIENSENPKTSIFIEEPKVTKLKLLQNIGCTVNFARNKLINQLIKL